jgi:hypothetical protein
MQACPCEAPVSGCRRCKLQEKARTSELPSHWWTGCYSRAMRRQRSLPSRLRSMPITLKKVHGWTWGKADGKGENRVAIRLQERMAFGGRQGCTSLKGRLVCDLREPARTSELRVGPGRPNWNTAPIPCWALPTPCFAAITRTKVSPSSAPRVILVGSPRKRRQVAVLPRLCSRNVTMRGLARAL